MKNIQSVSYTYCARQKALAALCRQTGVFEKAVIGKSCGGREIAVYRLGRGRSYRLLAAAFHGSEHLTAVVLMMLMEEIAQALCHDGAVNGISIKEKLQDHGLLFVPCVNPDGCEISLCGSVAAGSWRGRIERWCGKDCTHWNANLRGVDINHNFNAGWRELRQKECDAGIFGPGPTRFGGFAPESEPETKAITALCRTLPIDRAAALHSQGEVIYPYYGDQTPACTRRMAEVFSQASGYQIEEPVALAAGGGFKDWFIETFCRPGFTFELGRGENPLPPEQAAAIYEKAKEMLLLFAFGVF